MNNRPLIGVVPLMDYKLESLWMLPGYMDGITEAGGTPVMLPLTEDPDVIRQLVALCDGILVTGGQDVAPEMYGESASPEYLAMNPELSPELDRMEMALIPEVIAADKPMLGICRGIQILNAVLGGTMWHDLPTELPSDVEHHMPNPPYDLLGHEVDLVPGTPLAELMAQAGEGCRIAVNSYHHQAVREVASELAVMAKADDGVIEALPPRVAVLLGCAVASRIPAQGRCAQPYDLQGVRGRCRDSFLTCGRVDESGPLGFDAAFARRHCRARASGRAGVTLRQRRDGASGRNRRYDERDNHRVPTSVGATKEES